MGLVGRRIVGEAACLLWCQAQWEHLTVIQQASVWQPTAASTAPFRHHHHFYHPSSPLALRRALSNGGRPLPLARKAKDRSALFSDPTMALSQSDRKVCACRVVCCGARSYVLRPPPPARTATPMPRPSQDTTHTKCPPRSAPSGTCTHARMHVSAGLAPPLPARAPRRSFCVCVTSRRGRFRAFWSGTFDLGAPTKRE